MTKKKPPPVDATVVEAAQDKADLWMPLWIGDYLADTMNLPRDLHGAYLLLLMAYWRNRGPLPDDKEDLLAIMRASADEWDRLRSKVLLPFFKLEPLSVNVTLNVTLDVSSLAATHVWRNKRSDEELAGALANRAAAIARTAKATAVRLAKQAAAAGAQPGEAGSGPGVPPAPTPGPTALPTAEGVPVDQRDVARDVDVTSLSTFTPSPSPSPSPTPTGYSVSKDTGAAQPQHQPAPAGPSSRQPVVTGQAGAPAPNVTAGPIVKTPEEQRKSRLWIAAKHHLEQLDNVAIAKTGGVLAKLSNQYGPEVFLDAAEKCTAEGARPGGSFVAYLTATCQHLCGERQRVDSKQARVEAGNDAVLDQYLRDRATGGGDAPI